MTKITEFSNYYLVVPYNVPDLDDNGLPVLNEEGRQEFTTHFKILYLEGLKTYEEVVEELGKFCIAECNVNPDDFAPEEVEAMILKMGIWDEKIVPVEIDGEIEEMPFLQAHAKLAKLSHKEDLILKEDPDAKVTKTKRINFTKEENLAGQRRSMQLMPTSLQTF